MADDGWKLGHRPGLDVLRGLAVLGAVWAHTSPGVLRGAGSVGVGVFFTLSGFLITRLLLEERMRTGRVNLRAFYGRRARRLLPVLPVFAVLTVAMSAYVGVDWRSGLIGTATYSLNYRPDGAGLFLHGWSLAVEEHFYLFWPVLVLVLRPRGIAVAAGALATGSAVLRLLETDPEMAYRATHLRLDALLVGALGAFVVARWRPSPAVTACAVLVLALALLVEVETFVGVTATGVSLAALVVTLRLLEVPWRIPWLERLGVISYGVYLFHYPISRVLRDIHVTAGGSGWLYLAILALSVTLAELSYRRVEAPWRRPRSLDLADDDVGVHLGSEACRGAAAGGGVGDRYPVL